MYLHKLLFDLYLAAGSHDYLLHYYLPTVDQDGWDFAVSDNESERRIQLKTRLISSSTKSWPLQRQLIRPDFITSAGLLGSEYYVVHGLGGGAIAITIDPNSANDPKYKYTDFQIIFAFASGMVRRNKQSKSTAKKVLVKLNEGPHSGKINVVESLFVSPKSPEHLLALARLHTDFSQFWDSNLVQLFENLSMLDVIGPLLARYLVAWVSDDDLTAQL